MTTKNKIDFTIKKDDKEVKIVVTKPNRKDEQKSDIEYSRVFTELFRNKQIINQEVEKVARERNLWDDSREADLKELQGKIAQNERILSKKVPKDDGTAYTKLEARKVAIDTIKLRMQIVNIQYGRSELYRETAQAKAGDAKFNYKIWACTKYDETLKLYWKSVDDMLENADKDDVFKQSFQAMLELDSQMDPDWRKKLPEWKFLLEYGFCNDKLQLIDPVTKKLVDEDGKTINDDGQLINDEGKLVNDNGELIDENGNLLPGPYEFKD